MAYIDDAILEDVAKLLGDCGRQFRKLETVENTKIEGLSSLVELGQAREDAAKFSVFAAVCDRYAGMVMPALAATPAHTQADTQAVVASDI